MEKTISEVDILNELVAPDVGDFSPDAANALLALSFTANAVARMNDLAEKNRLDALSGAERAEMEKYLRVGNFLSVIKAKARLSLAKNSHAP